MAIDIWSAGVILLCILSTRYPFFHSPDDLISLVEIAAIFGTKELKEVGLLLQRKITFPFKEIPKTPLKEVCERYLIPLVGSYLETHLQEDNDSPFCISSSRTMFRFEPSNKNHGSRGSQTPFLSRKRLKKKVKFLAYIFIPPGFDDTSVLAMAVFEQRRFKLGFQRKQKERERKRCSHGILPL